MTEAPAYVVAEAPQADRRTESPVAERSVHRSPDADTIGTRSRSEVKHGA